MELMKPRPNYDVWRQNVGHVVLSGGNDVTHNSISTIVTVKHRNSRLIEAYTGLVRAIYRIGWGTSTIPVKPNVTSRQNMRITCIDRPTWWRQLMSYCLAPSVRLCDSLAQDTFFSDSCGLLYVRGMGRADGRIVIGDPYQYLVKN